MGDVWSALLRLGLDLPEFNSGLETHAHQTRVLQDLKADRSRGVRGAPCLFLNGKISIRRADCVFGVTYVQVAIGVRSEPCNAARTSSK
jgi:hypothetical protein